MKSWRFRWISATTAASESLSATSCKGILLWLCGETGSDEESGCAKASEAEEEERMCEIWQRNRVTVKLERGGGGQRSDVWTRRSFQCPNPNSPSPPNKWSHHAATRHVGGTENPDLLRKDQSQNNKIQIIISRPSWQMRGCRTGSG